MAAAVEALAVPSNYNIQCLSMFSKKERGELNWRILLPHRHCRHKVSPLSVIGEWKHMEPERTCFALACFPAHGPAASAAQEHRFWRNG